jgi:hypothetical protein
MYISILKCGPGLLFIGLSWPSVQVEFDMPALEAVCSFPFITSAINCRRYIHGYGTIA